MIQLFQTTALHLFVTDFLTHCCLVDLIDVTLASEEANSKLVQVVTVADIDAEKHFEDWSVQIWKLKKFWTPHLKVSPKFYHFLLLSYESFV